MKKRTILGAASAVALAVGTLYLVRRDVGTGTPPIMNPEGETKQDGLIVKRRTIDYEAVIRSALSEKAKLIALTLEADLVRDQHLETSIRYTPFPASRARVRVTYHVEYAFGFPLEPGDFSVSREAGNLVVIVGRPQLVASPSIKLLSYQVLESGILVDEKTAIIELQQQLQPQAEKRAKRLLNKRGIAVRSERVLRRFLQGVLVKAAAPGTDPPPPLVIRYR